MGNIAINVENLGKQYRIGVKAERYYSLRDNLVNAIKSPLRRLQRFSNRTVPENEMFWALKDVSFEVNHGEVLGIIGRNGAGKSTLLKILSRITDPTEGRARVYGRIGSLLEVGTGFHPELTGRENIYLSGAVLGMRKAEINGKFDEIVDFAGVEKFLDTPSKRYSSGMYVRLAFAVAAHLEPEILLVDEVLAVGDSEFQKKCIGKMGEVAHSGRTVLLVSHQMTLIEKLCPRSVLLDGGLIVRLGDSSSLVKTYLSFGMLNNHKSLVDRKDRQGNGVVRFASFRLEDVDSNTVNMFRTGEKGTFVFEFEKIVQDELTNLSFALGIDGPSGDRISLLSSQHVNAEFGRLRADQCSVLVHIEKMPLMPGTYGFTIFCTVNGEIADWIQNAGLFEVAPGDYWGTGKLPPEGQSLLLIDHSFSLRPE